VVHLLGGNGLGQVLVAVAQDAWQYLTTPVVFLPSVVYNIQPSLPFLMVRKNLAAVIK
jgi:hypothetical protein